MSDGSVGCSIEVRQICVKVFVREVEDSVGEIVIKIDSAALTEEQTTLLKS